MNIKKTFIIFIILFLLTSAFSVDSLIKIVVIVNNKVISSYDFDKYWEIYKYLMKVDDKDKVSKTKALRRLIEDTILFQLASDVGVEATDESVNKWIEQEKLRRNRTEAELLKDFKIKSIDQLRYVIKMNRTTQDFIKFIMQTTDNKWKVGKPSEDEIVQEYEKNKASYFKQEKFQISHIFIRYPENKNKLTETMKKADEVFEKAKSGENWGNLVLKYSEDEESRSRNGELGNFTIDELDLNFPGFSKTVNSKKLKKGDFLLIESRDFIGLHIIKLLDHTDSRKMDFEESRNDVFVKLLYVRAQKKLEVILESEIKKAKIDYRSSVE